MFSHTKIALHATTHWPRCNAPPSPQGWLELGNHLEANEELEKITASLRAHPDVIELRWQIHAEARKWEACCDIANALISAAPERAEGWIHYSYALHEMKRTKAAFETLFAVSHRFGNSPTMAYNLACYACQLGELETAMYWLRKAFQIGGKEYKMMALDDRDLEPLWAKDRTHLVLMLGSGSVVGRATYIVWY